MAVEDDPRRSPAALDAVAGLLAAGAEHYAARRFWHAHEAWESAWHALRSAGEAEKAAYVRGMILVTAAFENATREKELGFKRQLAEALHALMAHRPAAAALIENAQEWEQALVRLHVDSCRRVRWAWWNASGWEAPPLRLRNPDGA